MSKIQFVIAELKQRPEYERHFKDLIEDYEKVIARLQQRKIVLPTISDKQERKEFGYSIQKDEMMLTRLKNLIVEKRREILGYTVLPSFFMEAAKRLLPGEQYQEIYETAMKMIAESKAYPNFSDTSDKEVSVVDKY